MRLNKLFFMSFLLISSCTMRGYSTNTFLCENKFFLTNDFNNRFPEQGNYFDFIKSSYIDMYYYKNSNNNNCHYYLEYRNGLIVDEWGRYETDGKTINFCFGEGNNLVFEYSLYNSPTIDYILLGSLTYNNREYALVYVGTYIFSVKG